MGRGTGGTTRWRARVAGGMAGSLFLRTYERSEGVYQAMLARGFDGEVRAAAAQRLSAASAAWAALAVGMCGAVAALARIVP